MSKKRDAVYTDFYEPHLNGGRKANNPNNNRQAATEQMYVRLLTELVANRFEWEGLPDSVDVRFLELSLAWRGLAVFYKDKDSDKFFVAQGSGAGHTNFIDNPVSFTIIGANMQSQTLSAVATTNADGTDRKDIECVPIWGNYMRCPDLDIIYLYAVKLAKIDRTIEITSDNMRKSKVINASENERLTWVNVMKLYQEGQDVIFGSPNLDLGKAQVLDLGVDPLTLPNLMIARSKMWNDCMGMLGINNANQDKKERLVAAEVGANDEQVQSTRNIALNSREQACEIINRVFGQNITVKFKVDKQAEEQAKKAALTAVPDGDDNEQGDKEEKDAA